MHKIIILDGADKVGKSECISSLVTLYEELGYKVLPMFSKEFTKFGRTINYANDELFDTCFDDIPNMYDITSGHLQTISFFVKHIFDMHQNEKFVIIFDRLQMSSLVFGLTLRPYQFTKIWGSTDNYVKYMNIFEKRIQRIADVKLIVFINNSNEFEPDNENFIKMSSDDLSATNIEFSLALQLSKISNKFLVSCTKDKNGYFNTRKNLLEILEKDFRSN